MKKQLMWWRNIVYRNAESYAPALALVIGGALDYGTGWLEALSQGRLNGSALEVIGGLIGLGRLARHGITAAKLAKVIRDISGPGGADAG